MARHGTVPRYGDVVYSCNIERMVEVKGNDEFLFHGDLTNKDIAFHFHSENLLSYLQIIVLCRGVGSDKYFVAATAKAEI